MEGENKIGDGTDGATVLALVGKRLSNDSAANSLWRKVQEEMSTGGVAAAVSYLRTRVNEGAAKVAAALPANEAH